MYKKTLWQFLILFVIFISANFVFAATPTTVSTFNSISLYWSPSGGESSKSVFVQFRESGETTWRTGLTMKYNPIADTDLELTDYRGSIVMLESGTTYEIKLTLEGTSETETITATTWSENFPIAETITINSSSSRLGISKQGSPDGYILYDGTGATIDVNNNEEYCINLYGCSYVIIRGVTLKGAQRHGLYLHGDNTHDIVIEDCDISGWGRLDSEGEFAQNNDAGIFCEKLDMERVIVQRNKIHHPRYDANSLAEYNTSIDGHHPAGASAILFASPKGNNVIRYNELYSDTTHMYNDVIGGTANASFKGFPGPDSDINNNYIAHCWDDGIEAEGGNRNIRIWSNYIEETFVAIGNAATSIGPLYIWKNTSGRSYTPLPNAVNSDHAAFIKMGFSTDEKWMTGNMYVFNNTVLQPDGDGNGGLGVSGTDPSMSNRYVKHCMSRNNILHAKGSDNSISTHSGNDTSYDNDFDYDLHNNTVPSSHESSGITGTPSYVSGSEFNSSTMTAQFNLQSGTSGYDEGVVIPNFADNYEGSAPDMGAFEAGRDAIEYGINATTVTYSSSTSGGSSNEVPIANAGSDQTVTDNDGNNSESVTLDGSGSSDSDGSISNYSWKESSTEIATGETPTVSLTVGTHTITLTVTDNDGATASDDVVITVNSGPSNEAPIANAGADQTVTDSDGDNSESVTLDGSGSSDSDGSISSYSWKEGSTEIATGETPTVSLTVGSHTITLTVTDNDGATANDDVVITVNAGSSSGSTVVVTQPSGDGSSGNPYQIGTLGNLSWVLQNSSSWDKYFEQTADIDASQTATWDDSDDNGDGDLYNDANDGTSTGNNEGWSGIGIKDGTEFTGSYDGKGHKVDGLQIDRASAIYVGLFGGVGDGIIKNLGVTNIDYTVSSRSGGLVGGTDGSSFLVDNCYSTGLITATADADIYVLGGLVGYLGWDGNGGTVQNSYSEVNLITATTMKFIGGFIGYAKGGATVTKCYSTGNVTDAADYSGAFIGQVATGSTVSECYCTGNISSAKNNASGGFIGYVYSTDVTISNCYSTSSISGPSGNVGGFIGKNNGTVEYCYCIGANNVDTAQGFIDYQLGTVNSNYLDTEASGCTDGSNNSATEKTTSEMKIQSTYTDWNFTSIWEVNENYPNLKSNSNPSLESENTIDPTKPSGTGTSTDPYQIASLDNLSWVLQNSESWDKYFEQTANIDASQTAKWDDSDDDSDGNKYNDASDSTTSGNNEGWSGIGINGATTFTGNYDGKGFIIDSLTIDRESTRYLGFFGEITAGSVENLGLTNINYEVESRSGGIVGYCDNNIIDSCYTTGSLTANINDYYIGGLAGLAGSSDDNGTTVSNSYSEVVLACGKANGAGGFIGGVKKNSTIFKCYSNGNVDNPGDASGAFIGYFRDSQLSESYCLGSVTNSIGKIRVSAFVGDNYRSTISNCYATGSISGTTHAEGTYGGFVGRNTSPCTIEYCYSIGANNIDNTKGFAGIAAETSTSNYLDGDASGCTDAAGVATVKTTSEMKTESTYSNWDFTNIWQIGGNYPNLINNSNSAFEPVAASGPTVATAPSGDGTSGNPYQISTLGELSWVLQNSSSWDKYFEQTADIDASQTATWDDADDNSDGDLYNDINDTSSVGNNEGWSGIGVHTGTKFSGTYDGKEHTIDGVVMKRASAQRIGFFSSASSGSIKNLGLTNIDFTFDSFAGGLLGDNEGSTLTVDSCYTTGILTVDNGYVVGGLVGYIGSSGNGGTVSNSYSEVDITTNGINYAGGLIGMVKAGTVSKCYTTGNVGGTHSSSGAFIGELQLSASVSECYSTGNLTSNNSSSTNLGAFIGSIRTSSTVSKCYSFGTVNGVGTPSGGFVGQNSEGTIEHCYSTGTNNISSTKGFLGNATGSTTHTANYFDGESSGCTDDSGVATSKTTAEMKTQSTFSSWDFSTVWEMNDNYPNLINNSNSELEGLSKKYKKVIDIIPSKYALHQNYPNPFNPSTVISFDLPKAGNTELTIYNNLGQKVTTLVKRDLSAGSYKYTFDAKNLSSGIYFYRLTSNNFSQVGKMLLVK